MSEDSLAAPETPEQHERDRTNAAYPTPEFRIATLEDAPAILPVIEAAFERWPEFETDVTPLEHLQWKMQSLPELELPHTVGEVDDRVVSVALRWAARIRIDGQDELTSMGTDQAIDPDYQGRGYTRLHRAMRQALPSVGDLGMGTSSRHERLQSSRGRRSDDQRALWWFNVWVRNLDLRGALGTGWRRHDGLPAKVFELPRAVARHLSSGPRAAEVAGVTLAPIERFDERADELWERMRDQFDLIRVHDARYLNWRYADPRSGRSEMIGAYEGDRLIGYAVFRPSGDTAVLADLIVEGDRIEVAVALMQAGVERVRDLGCRIVSAWLPPNHPLRPAMGEAGFVDSGLVIRHSFHRLRGSTAEIDLDRYRRPDFRFHIMMGDHDFI